MKAIEYSEADRQGLAQALMIARSGVRSHVSEGDEKLLGFLLRHGECDVVISVLRIEVRFSWLQKRKPSTYFGALAPGLVTQLMELGGIESVKDAIEFTVGPGSTGSDTYKFFFTKKWVRLTCSDEAIHIQVRDQQHDLTAPLRYE
ncbi:MAG: hypothetical protein ACAF42_14435 [Limnothrix sp. BL-A-16]|jgi:hypothetical protein